MRKTYDREFKLKISQDILEKKVTTKKIAEEYNISRPTISRWVSEYHRYGKNAFAGQGKRLPDKVDFYILEQENKRLTEENEILKKVRHVCEAKKVVRFEFVHKHHQQYSIQTLCRILNVSRQGYYLWRNRQPSRTQLRHNFLKQNIKRVFYEHKGRYGSPRIAQQLYDEGIETNKRVVAVLMRGMNLCAKGFHRRQSSYGRGKAIEEIVKENLLNRQFEQSQIDAVWVTDITYIPCNDGRLYLSTYIDLATRIPRCYMLDSNMKKEIVIHPLQIYKGELPTVIHSDRGSQYRSLSYQELLTDHHITHSMSQPGTPVDNAVIESFHRSIKRELIEPNKHKSKIEMKVLIQDYLEDYYPNKRIHTKFMMTPRQFEAKKISNLTDC